MRLATKVTSVIRAGITAGLLTAALFVLPVYLSLAQLASYGWVSLCILPMGVGVTSSVLLGRREKFGFWACFAATMISMLILDMVV